MIEINLARQLNRSLGRQKTSPLASWLAGGVMLMGVGVISWWWTQSLQQQVDFLMQEKTKKMQSLILIQEKLKKMEPLGEQKILLMSWIERINNQEKEKAWPIVLLDGISRSADGLDIWLERVQQEALVVELHGQSLNLEDIGKFIERLENVQVIRSLPVVEIPDRPEGNSEAYPFMIRFVFDQKAIT